MKFLIPSVSRSDVDAKALLAEVQRNNLLTELREVLDSRPIPVIRLPRKGSAPREVWDGTVTQLAIKLRDENLSSPHPKSLRQALIQGCKRYVRPNRKKFSPKSLQELLYQRDIGRR
jgi:hypothetical protein